MIRRRYYERRCKKCADPVLDQVGSGSRWIREYCLRCEKRSLEVRFVGQSGDADEPGGSLASDREPQWSSGSGFH